MSDRTKPFLKRIRLTCRCGAAHTLTSIKDLQSRCGNQRCGATLNINQEELWEYQESLMALMAAIGLGRDFGKELVIARSVSMKLASPYAIDIIEIPAAHEDYRVGN
ncbi:MAG TPA: hypothetical protein VEJ45_07125 [Candidatus Acidoferrales bacterium]|nr:hypothetical protein [Candidatus Acidoferrales bacterium]